MKSISYILGFFILIVFGLTLSLFGCGQEPVEKTTDRVIQVPGEPIPAPPEKPGLAGLFVSDENASEVVIYDQDTKAYINKVYLEFINTYGGVDYLVSINLTSGQLYDILDSKVDGKNAVFRVSDLVVTTEEPAELMYYTSNYSGSGGNHQGTMEIILSDEGIKVKITFLGTSRYRDGHIYFQREFNLKRVSYGY